MWQEVMTGIAVIGAVGFLVKKFFFSRSSSSGCGNCAAGEKPVKSQKNA